LQRFFGSLDWFNIPYKELKAYAVMLPVIQSEEMQQSIQSFSCGSGNLDKSQQQKIFRQLKKQATVIKDPTAEWKPKPVNYGALAMIMPVVDLRKLKNDGKKPKKT
jgi:hypothetical protein